LGATGATAAGVSTTGFGAVSTFGASTLAVGAAKAVTKASRATKPVTPKTLPGLPSDTTASAKPSREQNQAYCAVQQNRN
jgi:hypothetical protein